MSRRRRRGNPLLVKCILISVGANIILLPILAYFGAFKNIANSFRKPVEIVMVAPPVHDKTEAKKLAKQPPKVTAKGAGAKKSAGPKGKPLAQHVVAPPANPGASDTGNGPTVVNPDKGAAPGNLPTAPPGTNSPTPAGNGGPVATKAAPAPEATPKSAPVAPEAAPKPHVAVVTEVAATYSPEPTIPDDLRDGDLDAKVTVQVMVNPEGLPNDVKVSQSSGNGELDSLAVDAAKKWRFKPATKDGTPIASRVNLHIEFQVQ